MVPLAIFAVLVVVLGVGLKLDPRYVPSPLIDKAAPAFRLSTGVHTPRSTLAAWGGKTGAQLLPLYVGGCEPAHKSGCETAF